MEGWVPVGAALASAGCAAVASVLQHRSAHEAPAGRGLRLRLVVYLACRPAWLAGVLADAAALGFHAIALSVGRLVVVQPLLVSSLLFALPASALLQARRPSTVEWAWALLLVTGLATFLQAARPAGGSGPPDTARLVLLLCIAGAVAVAAGALGVGPARRHRAGLFGIATGVGYGVVAALIKYSVVLAGEDPLRLATAWPLYTLVGVGAAALVLNQAAYQAGSLAACLPPLTIADPVVAVIIGVLAFGEHIASTPEAVAGQLVGFAAMTVAILQLARRVSSDQSYR